MQLTSFVIRTENPMIFLEFESYETLDEVTPHASDDVLLCQIQHVDIFSRTFVHHGIRFERRRNLLGGLKGHNDPSQRLDINKKED